MNRDTRRAPAPGPALLSLIVAISIGCSDSGPVVLDGPPPSGDLGLDQLAHSDAQAADTQAADAQAADTQAADTQAADTQAADTQAADTALADALAKDAVVTSDGGAGFPQALDGIWLVGWIGGLNRFSWIRLSVTSTAGGTAIIQQGALSGGTIPYWSCSGSTTWNITAKPNTIQLHYPSSTCTGMKSESFTFTSIAPFSGTYPKGAQLVASIQALGSTPGTVSGYKFPPGQCDATMTTCTDPL